jgi:Na+/melibiose symporter-like transporter
VAAVLQNNNIRTLLIGIVLLNLAFSGMQSNFAVYSDRRFGFAAIDNAFVFVAVGLMAVIMQGFLLRMLLPKFGEAKLAMVGMVLMALGFEGLASCTPPDFGCIPPSCCWELEAVWPRHH